VPSDAVLQILEHLVLTRKKILPSRRGVRVETVQVDGDVDTCPRPGRVEPCASDVVLTVDDGKIELIAQQSSQLDCLRYAGQPSSHDEHGYHRVQASKKGASRVDGYV
jgi:hypothetical protein